MEKTNALLSKELAELIRNLNYKDRLVTVLNVETTSDFSEAKVWISILYFNLLNDKKVENQNVLDNLKEKTGEFRQVLGKKLHFKKIPKLIFKIDENPEKANKIDRLLDEIKSRH